MLTTAILTYAKFRHNNQAIGRLFEVSIIVMMVAACVIMTVTTNLTIIISALGALFFCGISFLFFKKADDYRRLMPN